MVSFMAGGMGRGGVLQLGAWRWVVVGLQQEGMMAEPIKTTGTTAAPNPKTGSSDAARGLGGHSKDASHAPGAPAELLKKGEATSKD